jgi:hypothetical protein
MGPFRDYRRVIQATVRCCDARLCAETRSQPALLRQVFQAIVEQSWNPAEVDRLHQAARSALL